MLTNSIKTYHNVYIFQDNMFYSINIFLSIKNKQISKNTNEHKHEKVFNIRPNNTCSFKILNGYK